MIRKKEIYRRVEIHFNIDVWQLIKQLKEKYHRPIKHIVQDAVRMYHRIRMNDPSFNIEDYMVIEKVD